MFNSRIILISNYIPDRQFSMLQYANMLCSNLVNRGIDVVTVHPEVMLGRYLYNKWIGYIDKIILFRLKLNDVMNRVAGNGKDALVHICDHSNSYYASMIQRYPTVITCHDLMAIRAADGEFGNNCPSVSGKLLQEFIKSQLEHSDYYICDSKSTQFDLYKKIPSSINSSKVIYPGFCNIYSVTHGSLSIRGLSVPDTDYILHVGSNAWYKNRAGVLEIFCRYMGHAANPNLKCVLVGPELDAKQVEILRKHELSDSVYVINDIKHEELLTLYTHAKALVFPSIYEGFGWPPLEAQSCDCPVISSVEGSLEEVVADSGLVAHCDDIDSHVHNLRLVINDSSIRQALIEKGRKNIARFSNVQMVDKLIEVYEMVSSVRK